MTSQSTHRIQVLTTVITRVVQVGLSYDKSIYTQNASPYSSDKKPQEMYRRDHHMTSKLALAIEPIVPTVTRCAMTSQSTYRTEVLTTSTTGDLLMCEQT